MKTKQTTKKRMSNWKKSNVDSKYLQIFLTWYFHLIKCCCSFFKKINEKDADEKKGGYDSKHIALHLLNHFYSWKQIESWRQINFDTHYFHWPWAAVGLHFIPLLTHVHTLYLSLLSSRHRWQHPFTILLSVT